MQPDLLWNRLEDITDSDIGPDGTLVAGPYVPCKYNNGFFSTGFGNAFALDLGSVFTLESWCKAVVDSSDSSGQRQFFCDPGNYNSFWNLSSANKLVIQLYYSGVIVQYEFPITFLIGDRFHLRAIYDASATDKIRLFKDGIEIANSSKVADNSWTSLPGMLISLEGTLSAAILDNIKIWSFAVLDFSSDGYNINTEDGSVPPVDCVFTPSLLKTMKVI